MDVIKTYKPGEHDTLKYQKRFGDRLVVVRYRRDSAKSKIYTTVELIVDERAETFDYTEHQPDQNRIHHQPPNQFQSMVAVRINYQEIELRAQIKGSGARWDQQAKVWRMPHDKAIAHGLSDRIINEETAQNK